MKTRIQYLYIAIAMIGLLMVSSPVEAQQDSQYTNYMYNHMAVNPAYAGSRGSLNIFGLYRNQWVGMDGAPETLDFSLNSPLGIVGLGGGLEFFQDKIGPSKQSEIAATVSYGIQLNDNNLRLNFGVRGGVSLLDIDPSRLSIRDPGDYDLALHHQSSPMFGFGAFLYQDNWYVGLSTPNILTTEYYDDIKISKASSRAHFYLSGGYVFELSYDFKLKPAVMVKMTSGAPVSADLSLNGQLWDRLTLGVAYRWDSAWSGLIGFNITERLMIGYAYDFESNALRHYNDGSHEIFLRFELGTLLRPKINPRFF